MPSWLARRVCSSNRFRSFDLPDGSPIMPVAPPTNAKGVCPARWKCTSSMIVAKLPMCSEAAVGSKPMYPAVDSLASCASKPGILSWSIPRHVSSSIKSGFGSGIMDVAWKIGGEGKDFRMPGNGFFGRCGFKKHGSCLTFHNSSVLPEGQNSMSWKAQTSFGNHVRQSHGPVFQIQQSKRGFGLFGRYCFATVFFTANLGNSLCEAHCTACRWMCRTAHHAGNFPLLS